MNEFLFGTLSTPEKRAARERIDRQGVQHQHRLEPRAPEPADEPVITVTAETVRTIERIVCQISLPEAAEIPLRLVRTEWDMLNWRYYQVWQAVLPARTEGTLVRYKIGAYLRYSRDADHSHLMLAEGDKEYSYLVGQAAAPPWSREAVIYQIFPDRFHPGAGHAWNRTRRLSDIYGGTISGIIDKLDYVNDLGFNCIWLNPFFPDHTHHGYHATDYFAVNPRLGTLEEVRQLVDKAHERGIRLLLDFVANHWGSQHETFRRAQADRDSDYYNWYYWKSWPEEYETYYTVRDLPKVNVDYPAARAYLLDSVRFWLGEIGFDGLRLDHVLGPSHDFWTELRVVAKETRTDAWLFGEATDSPAVQLSYEGRFDGCLDFMLTEALRNTFAHGTMDLAAFDTFLNQHEAYFPRHFSRPSFLDNHDVDRFLKLVEGDKRKLKVAALCQFTLSGPPIVYYGTEVGVSQERGIGTPGSQGMPECRQPMLWGEKQDVELRQHYRWLVQLRRQHPLLWQEARQSVTVDPVEGIYVYKYASEKETLVVALNISEKEQAVHIQAKEGGPNHTFALQPWSGDVAVFEPDY